MSRAAANADKLVDTSRASRPDPGGGHQPGPAVTRYELQPRRRENLQDHRSGGRHALNLAAGGAIEAPIPNKPAVGIGAQPQCEHCLYPANLTQMNFPSPRATWPWRAGPRTSPETSPRRTSPKCPTSHCWLVHQLHYYQPALQVLSGCPAADGGTPRWRNWASTTASPSAGAGGLPTPKRRRALPQLGGYRDAQPLKTLADNGVRDLKGYNAMAADKEGSPSCRRLLSSSTSWLT